MAATGFDYALGTMTPEEARTADDHLLVEFYRKAVKDELLSEGGLISARHPRIKELQERGVGMKPYIKAFPTEEDHFVVEPAGRLICREVDFIRIIKPGDRNSIIEREVEPSDKVRFAKRYEAWKNGQATAGMVGTPIAEIPFIDSALREELAYFNIHTAEALVELPDGVAQKFRGISQLKARVKHWLDGATSAAVVAKVEAEKKAQEAELQSTRDALKKLQSQMAELQAAAAKK